MNNKVPLLLAVSLIPVTALVCGTLLVVYDHPYFSILPFLVTFLTLPDYTIKT